MIYQLEKWTENKVLDKSWSNFIESLVVASEKIYKIDNNVTYITIRCGIAIESLPILVEKCFIYFLKS